MSKLNLGDTIAKAQRFQKELENLSPEALLDRKLDFDALPAAQDGERDLRSQQKAHLEYALVQAFGLGGWREPLETRRATRTAP